MMKNPGINNRIWNPPRLARWLLETSTRYEDNFSIFGDFDEEFSQVAGQRGRIRGSAWYWKHVLRSLPYIIRDIWYWRIVMFKNYLKVAFRLIRRQKAYAFITITGLALGMAVCLMILLWIMNELSYDRFHEHADRIYRVGVEANLGRYMRAPVTMSPAGPAMANEFPEVVQSTRIRRPNPASIRYQDQFFQQNDVGYADQGFFDVFSFPLLMGDRKTALATANTVVITESTAKKIFGNEDPMGKLLYIDGNSAYAVTGVLSDCPENSHLTFTMLRSLETLRAANPQAFENWGAIGMSTYLLLEKDVDAAKLTPKLDTLIERNIGDGLRAIGGSIHFFLQPLTKVHLFSDFEVDMAGDGDISYVYLFGGIALFVLLIACINFINLSTARSAKRAQEVGMRKTLGAIRRKLVHQFLGESLLYSLISFLMALILVILLIPWFNNLLSGSLSARMFLAPWFLAAFFGLAVLVGLLSGSYPALLLSGLDSVQVLKGGIRYGVASLRFRRVLVVLQFTISIVLIIGTMTIGNQLQFLKSKPLGFSIDRVLIIPDRGGSLRQSYQTLKYELQSVPGVLNVSVSNILPFQGIVKQVFQPEGFTVDDPQTLDVLTVDPEFIPMMKIGIKEGRNFSEDMATDSTQAVIINEVAAQKFGWEDPLGKTFLQDVGPPGSGSPPVFRVIGVVKDFHMTTLHNPIDPLIMFWDLNRIRLIILRLAPGDIPGTMEALENKWKTLMPQTPFNARFLEEIFDGLYRGESSLAQITLLFSVLAVAIGCLGLFGLAAFMAEKRTKEIGIRKVMGATIPGIVGLISKEFVILVAVSNLFAWPIAFLGLRRWLQNFEYRADIAWQSFLFAGILALVIAILTVSTQAIKAACMDPVNAVRYE